MARIHQAACHQTILVERDCQYVGAVIPGMQSLRPCCTGRGVEFGPQKVLRFR